MTAPNRVSLARPLAKLASACFENSRARPAAGEIFDSAGLIGSAENTIRCWIALPPSAARAQQEERNAKRCEHIECERLGETEQARTVSRKLVGMYEDAAQRHFQVCCGRRREHHQRQRAAGDHKPIAEFRTFDDVAALDRFIKPLRCRVFCMFAVVAFVGHTGCSIGVAYPWGTSSCNTPPR